LSDVRSISISNFRSIKGNVEIPLNAPIVLLHGTNGAGKTSVLSALQLALTGDVSVLRMEDTDVAKHLVHKSANKSTITLNDSTGSANEKYSGYEIRKGNIDGTPFLNKEEALFFNERCYLAQSTLGKLLKIYQVEEPNRENALLRFVKELLKIDQLDALIYGLFDQVKNKIKTKKAIPEYQLQVKYTAELEKEIRHSEDNLTSLQNGRLDRWNNFLTSLKACLDDDDNPFEMNNKEIRKYVNKIDSPEDKFVLTNVQKRLSDTRQLWDDAKSLTNKASNRIQKTAEEREQRAEKNLKEWQDNQGTKLTNLVESIEHYFETVPSSDNVRPRAIYNTSHTLLRTEIKRLDAIISRVVLLQSNVANVEAEIKILHNDLSSIEIELLEGQYHIPDILDLLTEVIDSLESNDCPICDRDFGELDSSETLREYVRQKHFLAKDKLEKIQSLKRNRILIKKNIETAIHDRDMFKSSLSGAEEGIQEFVESQQFLKGIIKKLESLEEDIEKGELAYSEYLNAREDARFWVRLDKSFHEMTQEVSDYLREFDLVEFGRDESLYDAVKRLEKALVKREKELIDSIDSKSIALRNYELFRQENDRCEKAEELHQDLKTEWDHNVKRNHKIDKLRSELKLIGEAARRTKTRIVHQVFNQSLNKLWADLFIRLAPDEMFIPSFKVPTDGELSVQLETTYGANSKAGKPGAMLSAGNLNTAAMTLFLALNLSVKPKMPYLILDDPVQSMDELHITQFAALIRTLSKRNNRKVIIAVHSRALFDYLCLELSPAFDGDKLIAAEIKKNVLGDSEAIITEWEFEQDDVKAA